MPHQDHVTFVAAAIRDELGLTGDTTAVTLTTEQVDEVAHAAVNAALTWVTTAAVNGQIPAHVDRGTDPRDDHA